MFVSDANGIVDDMGRLLVERARRFDAEGSIDPQTIPGLSATHSPWIPNFDSRER